MSRFRPIIVQCLLVVIVASTTSLAEGQQRSAFSESLFGDSPGWLEEPLETDRDSFTPATTVMERQQWLIESSYSFLDNRRGLETHSYPEILARVGVVENLEFRLGWNYEVGGGGSISNTGSPAEDISEGDGAEKESELLYGLKVLLTEGDQWIPQSALIVDANTPTSGRVNASQLTTAYVFGWTLPNRWLLDAALRYGFASEEEDHFNLWAPSIVLKVPFHERWHTHIEYFGIFTDNKASERASQYVSPGVHYLFSPDFEVGIRLGFGLNDDAARFFTNVGAGVRF